MISGVLKCWKWGTYGWQPNVTVRNTATYVTPHSQKKCLISLYWEVPASKRLLDYVNNGRCGVECFHLLEEEHHELHAP
jgi:hypothetical protein